jgi:phage shock protein A
MKGKVAPMSVMKRVSLIFKSKANKALDRMEDPRETLDYSYQRQLEMLTQVRRGVADVATSRKRVELQMNSLRQNQNRLEGQAKQALGAGREDLAREALSRRAALQNQLTDLENQYHSLQADEEKLTVASQRLQAKVEAFRMQKETIKATYTAAEAQSRIGEAVSGISEEMGDVGMAVQRAQDKTAQMQARAGAIDELMASGALDDVTGPPRDDIQAELDSMRSGPDIELELQRLRGELGTGSKQAIEGGAAGSDGAATSDGAAASDGAARPAAAEQPQAGDGT